MKSIVRQLFRTQLSRNTCANRTSPKYYCEGGPHKNVLTEKFEEILIISLNRPDKRNCVNHETSKELLDAIEELETNDELKVGVLCGKGGNFCAGYDLAEVAEIADDEKSKEVMKHFGKGPMGPTMMNISKPMVAAIDGYAVAGGLELALMCDLRVCEEPAIMGVFCRRFGVPLLDGGTVRLPRIIGLSRALDLILTGRPIKSAEAKEMGLVNRVVSVGTALGAAVNLAQSLTKYPQECLLADRRSVFHSTFESKSMSDALQFEYENGTPIIELEAVAGARKFVDSKIGRHGKFDINSLDEILARHKPNVL